MTEQHDHATIERLTREEIRTQYLGYAAIERDLLERVIAAERSGGVEQSSALSDRDQKVRGRARARLNGHGHLLQPAPSDAGLSDIRIDLESVRLILKTLNTKAVEAAAVEALERAEQAKPAWLALTREWLAAAQKFAQIEQRAQDRLDELGGEVRELLPMAGWIGCGARIDMRGASLDDFIAAAKAQGVVRA